MTTRRKVNPFNHKMVAEAIVDGDGQLQFVDPVVRSWIENNRNKRFVMLFVEHDEAGEKLLQYAYYYGVVVAIGVMALRDLGYEVDKEQVDAYFKSEILKIPVWGNTEKPIFVPLDKKDMSVAQLSELIDSSIDLIGALPNGPQYPVPGPSDTEEKLREHLRTAAIVQQKWNELQQNQNADQDHQ